MSKPTNHGKRWSKEENQKLIEELSSGVLMEDICRQHGRSDGGIRSRIREIVYAMHINNKSITEIKSITNLNEDFISEIIDRRNGYGKKSQNEKQPLEILGDVVEEKYRDEEDERDMLEIIEDFKIVNERVQKISDILMEIDFSKLKVQILKDVIVSIKRLNNTISNLRSNAEDIVSQKTITTIDDIKEKFVSNHNNLVSLLDKLVITE